MKARAMMKIAICFLLVVVSAEDHPAPATATLVGSDREEEATETQWLDGLRGHAVAKKKKCLVQIQGVEDLKTGTRIADVGARLSVFLAREFAKVRGYDYHIYDCTEHCAKPKVFADAAFRLRCTHIFYIDSDVFIHSPHRADPVVDLEQHFADFILASGLDYRGTNRNPNWHNGKEKFYRTESNAGMLVLRCDEKHRNADLAKRLLVEWANLCAYYSRSDDQEAYSELETLPQYAGHVFVRDTLYLGQYSRFAKHFPGTSLSTVISRYGLARLQTERSESVTCWE